MATGAWSGECKALVDQQQAAQTAVDKVQSEAQRLRVELQKLPPARSITDLQRSIHRVQKQGDIDEQHRTTELAWQQLRERARVDLAKLPLSALSIITSHFNPADYVLRFGKDKVSKGHLSVRHVVLPKWHI